MGQMGLGYGSEYQLLRFLGHHRNYLEKKIHENTRFKDTLTFLDFPVDTNDSEKKSLSLDKEYIGIEFLKFDSNIDYNILENEWKKYWPQRGNAQNWDAVIKHNNEYILVEAKAHLKEMKDNKEGGGDSKAFINIAFNETKERFKIKCENNWFTPYYQLANRLAFINFLLKNDINASLLYIYFLNGYIKRGLGSKDKSVKDIKVWEEKINEKYEYLGLNDSLALNYVSKIFIDCNLPDDE